MHNKWVEKTVDYVLEFYFIVQNTFIIFGYLILHFYVPTKIWNGGKFFSLTI